MPEVFSFCTIIITIIESRLQIPGGCRFPGDYYHGGQTEPGAAGRFCRAFARISLGEFS